MTVQKHMKGNAFRMHVHQSLVYQRLELRMHAEALKTCMQHTWLAGYVTCSVLARHTLAYRPTKLPAHRTQTDRGAGQAAGI